MSTQHSRPFYEPSNTCSKIKSAGYYPISDVTSFASWFDTCQNGTVISFYSRNIPMCREMLLFSMCTSLAHNTLRMRQTDVSSKTTFSNACSWMKILVFCFKYHWSWYLKFQLSICQHWFRYCLGAEQATKQYLNQWCTISGTQNEISHWNQAVVAYLEYYCIFFSKMLRLQALVFIRKDRHYVSGIWDYSGAWLHMGECL